jgi:hypothetical protein
MQWDIKAQDHGDTDGIVLIPGFVLSKPIINSHRTIVKHTKDSIITNFYSTISVKIGDSHQSELRVFDNYTYEILTAIERQNELRVERQGNFDFTHVADSLNNFIGNNSVLNFSINDFKAKRFVSVMNKYEFFWGDRAHIGHFKMNCDTVGSLLLTWVSGKSLILANCVFEDYVQLKHLSYSDTLSFAYCKINDLIVLDDCELPSFLNLDHLNLSELKGNLDLTKFKPAN